MFCYKQMAVFLLFLPFPTTTPLFMALFITAMMYKFKPCIYCVALMIITYITTYNTSFFSEAFPPTQSALNINFTSNPAQPSSPYQSVLSPFLDAGLSFAHPVSPRGWGDFNGGKLLWPVLDGYKLVDKRRAQRKEIREKAIAARAKAKEPQQVENELDMPPETPSYNGDDEHFDPLIIDLEAEASRTEAPEPEAEQVPSDEVASTVLPPAATASRKSWFWSSKTPTPPEAPAPAPPAEPTASDLSMGSIPLPAAKSAEPSKDTMYLLGIPIKRRFDLRYKGIGLVVDLSGGRTEEAIRQEVEEWIEWEDQVEREHWQEQLAEWAEQDAKQQQVAAGEPAEGKGEAPDPPAAPRGWPWNRYLSKSKRDEATEAEKHRHSGIEHLHLVEL